MTESLEIWLEKWLKIRQTAAYRTISKFKNLVIQRKREERMAAEEERRRKIVEDQRRDKEREPKEVKSDFISWQL